MEKPVFLDDALDYFGRVTPQAEALRMLGRPVSYAALNARANEIAARLLSSGVQKGDRIIICAAKSPDAIAAIYAILRIGAVYVPIDPAAPPERMRAQIVAVSPSFVIADTMRLPRFEAGFSPDQMLDLSQDLSTSVNPNALSACRVQRCETDAAYILMTSGTTGGPKGIIHTHKSGLAYARMAAELCGLRPDDRVSNHTPTHFDMSIFDIFSTAMAGACIVIIPEMHAKLPASLSQLAQQERISVWYSVPYALIQLVERGALEDRDLSALRVVMFAGEKMPPNTLKQFAHHAPNALFLNAYGPTETNHCLTARFTHDDLDGYSPLPIGRPDCGVEAQVETSTDDPSTGELLIASDQVMRGYWQNLELTEAVFERRPARDGVTKQFYRTGDIVRQTVDGQFLLVGRKDRQVKLRGFRVELDEVELALVNTPNVTEAVAFLADDALHAFITGNARMAPEALRTHLAAVLPSYAIPQHIAWLPEMPRTSTGKIDRTKLKDIAHDQHAA